MSNPPFSLGRLRPYHRLGFLRLVYFRLVYFRLACLTLGLIALLLLPTLALSQQQDPDILQRAQQGIDSVTESTQTRYRREQRELEELEKQQRLAAEVQKQQDELKRLQWEREQLTLGRRPSSPSPRSSSYQLGEVEIFIASDCPDCLKVIGFLDALNVSFRIRSLDADPDAERDYLSRFGRGVIPLVRKGERYVRGYLPGELRRMLVNSKKTTSGSRKAQNNSNKPSAAVGIPPMLPPAKDTLAIQEPTPTDTPPGQSSKTSPNKSSPENDFDMSKAIESALPPVKETE